jgi:hypothetical protein
MQKIKAEAVPVLKRKANFEIFLKQQEQGSLMASNRTGQSAQAKTVQAGDRAVVDTGEEQGSHLAVETG